MSVSNSNKYHMGARTLWHVFIMTIHVGWVFHECTLLVTGNQLITHTEHLVCHSFHQPLAVCIFCRWPYSTCLKKWRQSSEYFSEGVFAAQLLQHSFTANWNASSEGRWVCRHKSFHCAASLTDLPEHCLCLLELHLWQKCSTVARVVLKCVSV